MQYFVGKVCSIVTTSMNRSFDEQISREHFVVRIRELNIDGLWGTHPYNESLVSFFNLNHIISIHQEIELDPNNAEHIKMIQEYEKKTGTKVQPDIGRLEEPNKKVEVLPILEKSPALDVENTSTGDAIFIDIANLEKLAESTKRTFDAYESR